MTIRPINQEDLVVWPDGTFCHYHELSQMSHMSDDYEIVPAGTPRYEEITNSQPTSA